jgi:hypothetical protein
VLCRRAALAWQITPDDWSDAVEAAIRAAEGGGDLEMRHRVVIDAAIAADRASGSELMTRDLAGLLVLAAMRKHLGHVQVVAAPSLDVTSLVAMSDGLGTMMFAISLNALDGGDRDDPPGVFVATAVAEEIARFRSMEPDALLVKIYVRALLRYRDGMSRRIAHPAAGVRDHWMLEFVTGMLHEVAGQDFRSGMRDLIS